ncbi:uncharacterized protein RCO7_14801 [Rhynchosporium graminicola]|uniref:Uncharacterized protein n=1 Tax=Rhynchosporium graminicola TaxID=2792576 RepID=A0A1E1L380_9HELO|nr:uncharacterized protein RCO7_14801 [Rhynchosporium commune]
MSTTSEEHQSSQEVTGLVQALAVLTTSSTIMSPRPEVPNGPKDGNSFRKPCLVWWIFLLYNACSSITHHSRHTCRQSVRKNESQSPHPTYRHVREGRRAQINFKHSTEGTLSDISPSLDDLQTKNTRDLSLTRLDLNARYSNSPYTPW